VRPSLQPHLLENKGGGAKLCKRGLQEVCPCKGGEPNPSGIDGLGQNHGQQNDDTGEPKYSLIDSHISLLSLFKSDVYDTLPLDLILENNDISNNEFTAVLGRS
jgi:hypothetical protein